MDFFAKDKMEKVQWSAWFSVTEIKRESLRSKKPFLPCMIIEAQNLPLVFGRPLQEVLDNEKSQSKLPKLVEKCCTYLSTETGKTRVPYLFIFTLCI